MKDEKPFDCVKFQREARARIDRELAGMTREEEVRWFEEQRTRLGIPGKSQAPSSSGPRPTSGK